MSLLGSRNFCFPFSHGQVSQLIQVMREQIRKRKVKALMQATTMTVIMDDKEDHRVILYRSDIPASEGGEGLLTVLKTGEKSVVDYEDDYCLRMARTVEDGLERLATPLHGDMDASVLEHLRSIIRFWTSDGLPAALKAGQILSTRLPNLTLVQRDNAHAVRPVKTKPQTPTLVSFSQKSI